jgi:uncharacterized membrane protein YfcA
MAYLLSEHFTTYVIIFLSGMLGYVISTLSGGGGSLILVPVMNVFIGTKATAPVIQLGNLIGEPARLFLFWKHIEWKIVKYYLPPAIVGAVLGVWMFASIKLEWLQIIVGLFLISTIFQFRFGKKERSFNMKLKGFIPLGFAVEFFSSVIGAVGPVLNPFYLNYGLEKEKMIATKTANSFFVNLVQITTYSAVGALKNNLWIYGIVLGIGASVGNWIGKILLQHFSNKLFRIFVIAIMVLSGVLMIARQLSNIF